MIIVALVCQLIFTNKIFRINKKKGRFHVILFTALFISGIFVYTKLINPTEDPFIPYSLFTSIAWTTWGWFTFESAIAFRKIQKNHYVEDWVKARYLMMVLYGFFTICVWILTWVIKKDLSNQIIMGLITIFAIFGILTQFLTWIMPRSLKVYLSRNYERVGDEIINADIIQFLSQQLTLIVKKSIIICHGLCLGSYNIYMDEVEKDRGVLLNYSSWKVIIKQNLKKMLIKSKLEDVDQIIDKILYDLSENASLVSLIY